MRNSTIAGYPIVLPEHRAEFHRQNPDWHKAWLDSIHSTLKPDDVVVDVGAEQGDLSTLVASWIPDGKISLIEPVAGFWPTIRETFEVNGQGPPWTAFVGFAASESSDAELTRVVSWPVESTRPTNADPGFQHLNERADIQRIRLDDLHGTSIATALMVDVEGAELKVLKGAEGLLTDHQPTVWCAIHPEIMQQRYAHTPNELLAFMFRLGYRWDFLDFAGELHFVFTRR